MCSPGQKDKLADTATCPIRIPEGWVWAPLTSVSVLSQGHRSL